MAEDQFEEVAEGNRVFRETVASWRLAGEEAIEDGDFDELAKLHLDLLHYLEETVVPQLTAILADGFSLPKEGESNG